MVLVYGHACTSDVAHGGSQYWKVPGMTMFLVLEGSQY